MKTYQKVKAKRLLVEGRSKNGCFIFPQTSFHAFLQSCERDYCEMNQPPTHYPEAKALKEEMEQMALNNQRIIAINVHCFYRQLSSRQKQSPQYRQGQSNRMAEKLRQLLGHKYDQIEQEEDSTLIHSYFFKAADLFQTILTIAVNRRAYDCIIDRFRKQNLEDCIQPITSEPASIKMNASQIDNLLMSVQRRQRDLMIELNLTKLGGKRLNQTEKETTSCQLINSTAIHVSELEIFVNMLRSKGSDVMALKMQWPHICECLTSLLKNWKMYQFDCGSKIRELVQLLQYKCCKFRVKLQGKNEKPTFFNLLDYLCPKISFIISSFNFLFKSKNLSETIEERQKKADSSKENQVYNNMLKQVKTELKIEQNVLDKLTVDYFSQLYSIDKGTGSFFVKVEGFQKKPLREFIGEIIQCQQFSFHWDDIFNLITINATKAIDKLKMNQRESIEIITRSKYPDPSCLGCTQFFLLNKSIINSYNNTPLRIFSDLSFKLISSEILEQVCYMLNSNGGVIFFSCAREYGSVLPKGAYIKQEGRAKKREQIEAIIQNSIEPRPVINDSIVVSFVPIVQNVRQKDSEEIKLQAIEDAFVMRIKVCSKDKRIGYLCKEQGNRQRDKASPNLNGKPNLFRSPTFGNPLNHRCKEASSFPQLQAIDKIFNHMSMIVIKQEHAGRLLKQLQQLGKSCYIQFKFQDYGFNIAKYTAVMYHNDSFEQILDIFNNNTQFVFQNKKVLAIYITEYLKIQMPQKLNNKDLENAILWLRKQFPTQGLKYFQLKKGKQQQQQEYYIKAESKLSTLYMYYVFNHFKVKTVYKNPPINELANLQEITLEAWLSY